MSTATTTIWTIYEHPADYPRHFVVRRWFVDGGESQPGPCELFDNLQEARSRLPRGLWNLRREDGDDQTIVESWI